MQLIKGKYRQYLIFNFKYISKDSAVEEDIIGTSRLEFVINQAPSGIIQVYVTR